MKALKKSKTITVLLFTLTLFATAWECSAQSWTGLSNMLNTRERHTTTLLPDGRVLVAGGFNGVYLNTAEVYDPISGGWTATANTMGMARSQHTATVLLDGRILVAGGFTAPNTYVDSAEIYDPATNMWSGTGPINSGRRNHTATRLPDGRVLVVGGESSGPTYLNAVEIYDPVAGTWSYAMSMTMPRSEHTATLLSNGTVLIAGGITIGNAYTDTSEIYTPGTNSWAGGGIMGVARANHTATALPDGTVLVVGGYNDVFNYLNNVDIYTVGTGWTTGTPLGTARQFHTGTLLPDGNVLVAGGETLGGILDSSEIYVPGTGWFPGTTMNGARQNHTATLLTDGRVFVVGGFNAGYLATSEVYDYAVGNWTNQGNLNAPRWDHTMTLMPGGMVLAAGGDNGIAVLNSAEAFIPGTGWMPMAPLNNARREHTATLLVDGSVLVVGGYNAGPLGSAERYAIGIWNLMNDLNTPRYSHTATLLPDGRVLVAGGHDGGNETGSCEIFDPRTKEWTFTGALSNVRQSHTATLLRDGRVLVSGGVAGGLPVAPSEIYDPGTGTWAATPGQLNIGRYDHRATLLFDGRVLVSGGFDADYLASSEIFDPGSGFWTPTFGGLNAARSNHTSALLSNGRVLVAGGSDGNALIGAEIFDPVSGTWTMTGTLNTARYNHKATVLLDGTILVAGGQDNGGNPLNSAEIFDLNLDFNPLWRPVITTASSPLTTGAQVQIIGNNFFGVSEASGGMGSANSSTNFPVVRLRRVENDQIQWLFPDPAAPYADMGFTSQGLGPPSFPDGHALVTVFTNGIPSESGMVLIDTTPPAISLVWSVTPNGVYGPGDTIDVTVGFSEPVTLSGTLTIGLDSGPTVTINPFVVPATSASGIYTVNFGDGSPDLNSLSPVTITGGNLTDAAGNVASDFTILPGHSLADTQDIVISALPPPGNSLDFDGLDDYVDCGTGINPLQFTVEAWVNIGALGSPNTVVSKIHNIPGYYFNNFELRVNPSGQIYLAVPNGVDWGSLNSANSIGAGAWNHLAATYDGTTARIYINGVQDPNTLTAPTYIGTAGTPLFIGRRPQPAGQEFSFNGRLDEVRIWDNARSQADIRANMMNVLTGIQPGLEAYYRFDQGTPCGNNTGIDTLPDLSGNLRHGTLSNNFALISGCASNWVASQAFYTWLGWVDSDWNNPANWMPSAVPPATGNILVPAGATFYPNITGTTSCANILLESGADLTVQGTFNVSGNFFNDGNVVAGGTVNLGGNWENAGTFDAQATGTMNLTGGNQKLLGTTMFYNLTKIATTPSTLTFGAGNTFTVAGAMNLQGTDPGIMLALQSSVPGTQWNINPQGIRTVNYLDVADSNNINALAIDATGSGCADSGNNDRWMFIGVVAVSSSFPAGSYGIGTVIPVQVVFEDPVFVSGIPQITLETGATDAIVNYTGGNGTDTLIFDYSVVAGHESADLDCTATTALAGTIMDAYGNPVNLLLPVPGAAGSLSAGNTLVIDGIVPSILSLDSTTPDGTYGIGALVNVTLNFSEPVTLSTGNLVVSLDSGGVATLVPAGPLTALTGTYTVASEQNSPDLNSVALSLSASATLRDVAGNTVVLTIPAEQSLAENRAIVIDTSAPSIVSVTSSTSDGTYGVGAVINVILNFSDPVMLSGGDLTVGMDTGGTAVFAPFGPSATASGTYTVGAEQNSVDLNTVSLSLPSGAGLQDSAGNDVLLTIPPGQSLSDYRAIVISTSVPTITSVTSETSDGTYGIGSAIDVIVSFSEPVTLSSGNLAIHLDSGGTVVIFPFGPAGTATGIYSVGVGEESADLNSVSPLVLDTGAILQNGFGANAVLDIPAGQSLADSRNLVVDGVRPVASITSDVTDPTSASPIPITIEFDEDVTGFAVEDITVTNGTLANVMNAVPARIWMADVIPTENGTVTVRVGGETVVDAAGNVNAEASLSLTYGSHAWVINEIFAVPGMSGDANGDGVTDPFDDQFVEIVNTTGAVADISGWALSDGQGVRHIFPSGTVVPTGSAIVVFGGGSPFGKFGGALVQTASSGALGLDATGVVKLSDDMTALGLANFGPANGESVTRDPDVTGGDLLTMHSAATGSNGTFYSPGRKTDGSPFGTNTAPNATYIPGIRVPMNSESSEIDLWNVFEDAQDDDGQMDFSVSGANPRLFSSLTIVGNRHLVIVYAPGVSGTSVVTVTARDTAGSAISRSFTVNVGSSNVPPEIAGQTALSMPEDTTATILLSHLTIYAPDSTWPSGYTLMAGQGDNYTLMGNTVIPDPDWFGTLTVPVTVNDGHADSAPFDFHITVRPVNDAPVLDRSPIHPAPEDQTWSYRIPVVDPDGDIQSFHTELPLWMSFTDNGDGSVSLSGTPENDHVGTHHVTIRVTDPSGMSDRREFDVAVLNVNDPPVIVGQKELDTSEEDALTLTLDDFFVTDPDNDYPDGFTIHVSDFGMTILPDEKNITAVALGDMDGDGLPDLVLGTSGRPDRLFLNTFDIDPENDASGPNPWFGDGGADISDQATNTAGMILIDQDVDGDLDIVGTDAQGKFWVFRNDGGAFFYAELEDMSVSFGNAGTVAFADVNRDGLTDLVRLGSVRLYLNSPEFANPFFMMGDAHTVVPVTNFAGRMTVPVRVNDGTDFSNLYPLELQVASINDPPLILGQKNLKSAGDSEIEIAPADLAVMDTDNAYPNNFSIRLYRGDHYVFDKNKVMPDPDFNGVLIVPVSVFDGESDSNKFELKLSVGPDGDHDGMDDNWEMDHDLDPAVNDAGKDWDGDGYPNIDEYRCGSLPNNPAAYPMPPVAVVGPDRNAVPGFQVALSALGSKDPDGTSIRYAWVQTDGTPVGLAGAQSAQPSFMAPDVNQDVLEFQLTVTDACGQESTATAVVRVARSGNTTVVAEAGPNRTDEIGDIVTLDGTASASSDGAIVSYHWEQTGGPRVDFAAEASVTTFTAMEPGTLAFMLTVQDVRGSFAWDRVIVTVLAPAEGNLPPEIPAAVSPENEAVIPPGQPVVLRAGAFADPEGDSHFRTKWTLRKYGDSPDCPDPVSSISVNALPGNTEFTIPTDLKPGMKYVWQVGYQDSGSGKMSLSEEYAFKVGAPGSQTLSIPSGNNPADFKSVSIHVWPDDPLATAVFGPAIGEYDTRYFLIGTYDPEIGDYREYGPELVVEPGRGYWFFARNGLTAEIPGVPVTLDTDVQVRLKYLAPDGWNMIACPNNRRYQWADLEVKKSGCANQDPPKPVSDLAPDNSLMDTHLYYWKNGAYAEDTAVLEPGEGYWVKALDENVVLIFPKDAHLVTGKRIRSEKTKSGTPPAPPSMQTETDTDSTGGCFFSTLAGSNR